MFIELIKKHRKVSPCVGMSYLHVQQNLVVEKKINCGKESDFARNLLMCYPAAKNHQYMLMTSTKLQSTCRVE